MRLPSYRWLGVWFDTALQSEPDLLRAYTLEDYPEPTKGATSTPLYVDGKPVAYLWFSKATGGLEIVPAEGAPADFYVAEALRLRLMRERGDSVEQAHDSVLARYQTQ